MDTSYMPTPEEIRHECQAIQRGWSAAEEKCRRIFVAGRRSDYVADTHWRPPRVELSPEVAAAVNVR